MKLIPMSYLEWKLNQELNGRSTFEKDEKFYKEYQEYLKDEYRKKPEPREGIVVQLLVTYILFIFPSLENKKSEKNKSCASFY